MKTTLFNPKTSKLDTSVLAYDSLPRSQSDPLLLFQPITKQLFNFSWSFRQTVVRYCAVLDVLSHRLFGRLLYAPVYFKRFRLYCTSRPDKQGSAAESGVNRLSSCNKFTLFAGLLRSVLLSVAKQSKKTSKQIKNT